MLPAVLKKENDIGARNSQCRWWKIKFGGIGFLCMVELSFVGLSFAMLNFHFIRLSFLLSNFVNIQKDPGAQGKQGKKVEIIFY